jgi:predicted transcriptional regulator
MKVMSLRMENELVDRLDEWAAERGWSRNTAISRIVAEKLGAAVTTTGKVLTEKDFEVLADEAEKGYDVEKLVPRREVVLTKASDVKAKACPHPKDKEQRLAWGTVCGLCKVKLR